jgi:hypothetical protein
MAVHLEFQRPPSAAMFMLRAFAPSPGLRRGAPELSARWRDCRVDPAQLAAFNELTGLNAGGGLSILYPHVIGFRLIMAVLTHPAYPLPIWNALQIRNRLIQHEPIPTDATLTYQTSIGEHRFLEKGVEIDLRTLVHVETTLAWESVNTFYYRGRFGAPRTGSPRAGSPNAGETQAAAWRTLTGVGWRFGGLTGDYNGVHMSDGYARRFGFKRAFHHPQLIIGQCLARLPPPADARQELETWVKGPVPYGVDVRLNAATESGRTVFALFGGDETRPAIVGRWGATA